MAAGQCTKVNPQASPTAAGLLGCGVMAGFGAATYTGSVGRGDTVAVFGCGGVGDAAIAAAKLAGARDDHRGRPRRQEARTGPRTSGRPTPSTPRRTDAVEAVRELTDGYGADVVHRGGRQPRGARAGVLRPRPRRHRRPGRRADARHEVPRHPDDRVLRPGRGAEAVVVRRLPADARLPGAHRAVPAGPLRPRPLRLGDDPARRASRRPSTRWSRARCSARWWCSTARSCPPRRGDDGRRPHRPRRHLGRLLARRPGLRRRQQHLAPRRRRRGADRRRRPRRRPHRRGGGRPPGAGHRLHARPQRPHQRGRRARRTCVDAPIALHPADRMLWDVVYPDRAPELSLAEGELLRAGAAHCRCSTRRATPPAACACTTRPATCSVATPCSRAAPAPPAVSYSDFPTIIESIRAPPARAARADGGAHRPRRLHDDRRRGPPPRGVDRGARRAADAWQDV